MQTHRIIRITKSFSFEMAHVLTCYDGDCCNLHGHSYKLHVTLRGLTRQEPGHPKDGMLLDFGDLKKLVQASVLDTFDHALAISELEDPEMVCRLRWHYQKVAVLPFQPTCENLLLFFVEKIQERLPGEVELFSVKLEETATSFAEWCCLDFQNFKAYPGSVSHQVEED